MRPPGWLRSPRRPSAVVARWVRRSVANRVAFLGALLAGIFVVFAGTASFFLTRGFVLQGVRSTLAGQASVVAERVEGTLGAVDDDVRGLAHNSLVVNALVDSSGRSAYLQPFLRDHGLPGSSAYVLRLVDHRGRVIASNDGSTSGYGSRAWWAAVLERGERHAELTVDPDPSLTLAYPVVYPGTGRAEGALVLELPLRPTLERAARDLPAEHSVRFLAAGRPLLRVPAAAPREPPAFEATEPIHAERAVAELRLSVMVAAPRGAAFGLLARLGLTHALGGAVALAVAAWVVNKASRRLLAPLIQLSRAAEAIGSGRAQGEVGFEVQGEDEPAQLGRTLQHMLEHLQTAREGLEARVAERTQELELAESRLRAILDHMLDGLVTLDEQGRIESFSPAAERIFGWRAQDVVGCNAGVLMPEPHASAHQDYVKRAIVTGERRVVGIGRELEAVRRDGIRFPIELQVTEVHHRGRRLFVGIVRDITERRKVERMKNEFVSVVSHELRTPLTSIRGALGLVAGGAAGPVPASLEKLLRVALDNSLRLTRLIDDLLDVQRIEAGALRIALAPAPVAGLLEEAVALNQAFAHRLHLEIALAAAPPHAEVAVDAGRFQQVMSNLLSNACKFSPPGARVDVHAEVANGRVRIEVRDRGPGISEAFRDRIFQKFSQADASSSRSGAGTGLGLAITKGLVEGMHGEVGYLPRPEGGTTFFVELPLAQPRPDASGDPGRRGG